MTGSFAQLHPFLAAGAAWLMIDALIVCFMFLRANYRDARSNSTRFSQRRIFP